MSLSTNVPPHNLELQSDYRAMQLSLSSETKFRAYDLEAYMPGDRALFEVSLLLVSSRRYSNHDAPPASAASARRCAVGKEIIAVGPRNLTLA